MKKRSAALFTPSLDSSESWHYFWYNVGGLCFSPTKNICIGLKKWKTWKDSWLRCFFRNDDFTISIKGRKLNVGVLSKSFHVLDFGLDPLGGSMEFFNGMYMMHLHILRHFWTLSLLHLPFFLFAWRWR